MYKHMVQFSAFHTIHLVTNVPGRQNWGINLPGDVHNLHRLETALPVQGQFLDFACWGS